MDWTRLETSLHAIYLVGGRDREGRLCRHCSGSDHEVELYALRVLTHPRTEPKPGYMPVPSSSLSYYSRGKASPKHSSYLHSVELRGLLKGSVSI